MVIKNSQIRQFEDVDLQNFDAYMVQHLTTYFPTKTAILDPTLLTQFISTAKASAKQQNFTTRYEVCLYTDLLVMFGVGCFNDLSLPFFKHSLFAQRNDPPTAIIEHLYDAATRFLNECVTDGDAFPSRAFESLYHISMAQLEAHANPSALMGQIWPAKFLTLDDFTLREFMAQSKQNGRDLGCKNPADLCYFTLVQFVLGHQFYNDMLYPTLQINSANSTNGSDTFVWKEWQPKVNTELERYYSPSAD